MEKLKKYDKYEVFQENKGIIFRNYKPGDEIGLSNVFNVAFQQNGGGFLQTPKIFHWRYIQFPDYEPRQINVAEDKETGELVGLIVGTGINYRFGNREYKFGVINDVSTLPGYTKRGIADNLMKMALNYFYDLGVDFSSLSADPRGFPRTKIYIPLGYKDIEKEDFMIQFTDLRAISRQLPFFIPVLPAISIFTLPYVFSAIKNKFLNLNKTMAKINTKMGTEYSVEIINFGATEEFRKRQNQISNEYFEGYHHYTKEEWIWCRVKVPTKLHLPSQIAIRDKSGEIVAGSTITSKNMYSVKLGLKFRIGIIKIKFVDEGKIKQNLQKKIQSPSKREIQTEIGRIYKLLLMATIKASIFRKNAFIMTVVGSKYRNFHWAFSQMGGFRFFGGTHMIREMKENVRYPRKTKPFYFDPGEELGAF